MKNCLLPWPTATAPRKPPQELELDSTSLQAVNPGHMLLFLLSARLLGRLSLVFLYSRPISVQEEVGVLGISSNRPEVFAQAGYPSANTSQCPDQMTVWQHVKAMVTSQCPDQVTLWQHIRARVTSCLHCLVSGSG